MSDHDPRDLRAHLDFLQARESHVREEHQRAKDEEGQVKQARIAKAEELNRTQSQIRDLRRKLANGASKGPESFPFEVTDRAVVDWLRYIEGVDIQGVREQILEIVKDQPARKVSMSVTEHRYRGHAILVRDGKVVGFLNPELTED